MASIYNRKNENGTTVCRAAIRIKGYLSISLTHDIMAKIQQEIELGARLWMCKALLADFNHLQGINESMYAEAPCNPP